MLKTCANADCPRHGIAIDLEAPVDLETGAALPVDVVICGWCAQQLADIASAPTA